MNQKEKTCCFTGHRRISKWKHLIIKRKLKSIIENLIKNGYVYFSTGGALGFDTIAAQTVLELKQVYNHIKLILVLPCPKHTIWWNDRDIKVYEKIKKQCDKCICVSDKYVSGSMFNRNRNLVDCSSVCVCYLRKETGVTAYTIKYGESKGIDIIKL